MHVESFFLVLGNQIGVSFHLKQAGERSAMLDTPVHAEQNTGSDAALIGRALLRAAEHLEIANKVLSKIIGLSESSLSRMRKGEFELDGKSLELAILFVRAYRSLDAIVGGDDAVAARWLRSANTALGAAPLEMLQTISGLNNVINYLDSRRARI